MPTRSQVLRVGYVGLALLDSRLAGDGSAMARRRRRVTKPVLVPLLAAAFMTDPRTPTSPVRRTTLVAQTAGWVGDVALLGQGRRPFLVGVAAFATGHLATLAGLQRLRGPVPLHRTTAGRAAAATWATTAPLLTYAAAQRDRAVAAPVLGYSGLLALLAARAGHLDPSLTPAARTLNAAGAWTFLLSDSLLAVRSFVLEESPPSLDRAVMLTYTTAQLLLAEGAARS